MAATKKGTNCNARSTQGRRTSFPRAVPWWHVARVPHQCAVNEKKVHARFVLQEDGNYKKREENGKKLNGCVPVDS